MYLQYCIYPLFTLPYQTERQLVCSFPRGTRFLPKARTVPFPVVGADWPAKTLKEALGPIGQMAEAGRSCALGNSGGILEGLRRVSGGSVSPRLSSFSPQLPRKSIPSPHFTAPLHRGTCRVSSCRGVYLGMLWPCRSVHCPLSTFPLSHRDSPWLLHRQPASFRRSIDGLTRPNRAMARKGSAVPIHSSPVSQTFPGSLHGDAGLSESCACCRLRPRVGRVTSVT
ncbi:hypothetical protein BO70DRAFT_154288 [Aspergillus heteromorphus CBS 117.55]|uniref:Uncharacterized protein n=1 Tax=Aspergillus heteromorphus CBS 117.55 TaxID=1448321 RepID=A0A317V8S8_9EURO|nr:uncharacterized protein BO70DRAFT_154288 [Aspergillus heteromorphus CBS 117.55]PWY68470.1 hypothetical protein BO70DRAFT_154288 [Aspergillus heteromorphus CBS 117.55]